MNTKRKEQALSVLWLCLYILCVGLGTVDHVEGIGKVLFVLTAVIFFIPGASLLVLGQKTGNRKLILRVRWIACGSIVLTMAMFCANLLAVSAASETGAVLHELLNLVSAPMFCAQYWVLSLFGWACLLSGSFLKCAHTGTE